MSNKNKTLLSEAQIRRMMKIAGVPALGETFISNYSRFHEEEEEEAPLEEPMPGEEDPMAAGEEPVPGEEDPMAAGGGEEVPQEKVEAIVDAVLAGIQQETGVPLERVPAEGEAPAPEGEPVPGEEEIAAAPEEGGEELPPEEEPVMEGSKYKREEDEKKDEGETIEEDDADESLEEALKAAGIELTDGKKKELVNEVARRVARRLIRASKRSK